MKFINAPQILPYTYIFHPVDTVLNIFNVFIKGIRVKEETLRTKRTNVETLRP
jgi:hypothetical protein